APCPQTDAASGRAGQVGGRLWGGPAVAAGDHVNLPAPKCRAYQRIILTPFPKLHAACLPLAHYTICSGLLPSAPTVKGSPRSADSLFFYPKSLTPLRYRRIREQTCDSRKACLQDRVQAACRRRTCRYRILFE